MLFAVQELESEICKLRGLLQMLHEDQPDVLEDVFEFHVGSLISHASAEHHARIRTCAQEMLAAIQALPRRREDDTPDFRLMPQLGIRPACFKLPAVPPGRPARRRSSARQGRGQGRFRR